jgi:hypothetical protein
MHISDDNPSEMSIIDVGFIYFKACNKVRTSFLASGLSGALLNKYRASGCEFDLLEEPFSF